MKRFNLKVLFFFKIWMPIEKVRVSGAAVAQDVDIVRGTASLPPTPMWRSSPWVGNHLSISLIKQLNQWTDLFTIYSTPLWYQFEKLTISLSMRLLVLYHSQTSCANDHPKSPAVGVHATCDYEWTMFIQTLLHATLQIMSKLHEHNLDY